MNRLENNSQPLIWFVASLLCAFVAGCGGNNNDGGGAQSGGVAGIEPTVTFAAPANVATGVATNSKVTAGRNHVLYRRQHDEGDAERQSVVSGFFDHHGGHRH